MAAENFGYSPLTLKSSQFEHKIYINAEARKNNNKDILHVYLDGDGTPWLHNRWVASDPTPINTMVLELMDKDTAPAILLGRPCYHGFSRSVNCSFKYWTSHRYAQQVVASMAQALNSWLKEHYYAEIVLIGFSGGGTLAVLMAPQIKNVKKIITLAANLDVAEWSRLHGYQSLHDSLNPATQPRLSPEIKQIHIIGKKDKVVPPQVVKSYLKKKGESLYFSYAQHGHHCCWVNEWSQILRDLATHK